MTLTRDSSTMTADGKMCRTPLLLSSFINTSPCSVMIALVPSFGAGVHVGLLASANETLCCDSEAFFSTLGLPSSFALLLSKSGATFLEDLLDNANIEVSTNVFLLMVVDLLCDRRLASVVAFSPLP